MAYDEKKCCTNWEIGLKLCFVPLKQCICFSIMTLEINEWDESKPKIRFTNALAKVPPKTKLLPSNYTKLNFQPNLANWSFWNKNPKGLVGIFRHAITDTHTRMNLLVFWGIAKNKLWIKYEQLPDNCFELSKSEWNVLIKHKISWAKILKSNLNLHFLNLNTPIFS